MHFINESQSFIVGFMIYSMFVSYLNTFVPALFESSLHLFGTRMTQDEIEKVENEEEEEEEAIFVLTDEWKEFFARSEAKRRLGLHYFYPRFHVPLLDD